MKHLIDLIGIVMMIVPWLAGIVLAKGLWSTLISVCLPPYAWYLVIERSMMVAGWL